MLVLSAEEGGIKLLLPRGFVIITYSVSRFFWKASSFEAVLKRVF